MKKTILVAVALCICSMSMKAQDTKEEGFVFTTVKENPITSIQKSKPFEYVLELLCPRFS